jgi:hypothetical protein
MAAACPESGDKSGKGKLDHTGSLEPNEEKINGTGPFRQMLVCHSSQAALRISRGLHSSRQGF